MLQLLFTEEYSQPEKMYPFTLTRHFQDIRVGILTIRQKWEMLLGLPSFNKKEGNYKDNQSSIELTAALQNGNCLLLQGNLLPTTALVKAIKKLKPGYFLSTMDGKGMAYHLTAANVIDTNTIDLSQPIIFKEEIKTIEYPWHIFQLNDWAIRQDFALLTAKRKSQKISKSNKVIKPSQVFIEKGARVEHAIINAATGPVYIGRNAEVMEGCIIRGPFAMGEGACLKMGAKVYGATTLGPHCVGGGEIKNAVLFGYSNKAHDGYLGDAVIGEWCNMGAGTTNSNLKNNVSDVSVWTINGEKNAGKKCGVFMGDYSRTAVNTAINTGTVIGLCCHVYGNGLTAKHLPSFSWGSDGITTYHLDKAFEDIEGWKKLKHQHLTEEEKQMLKTIFEKNT
jgi:UDP-N-acetylglucosamine diphosphorylase / glucose-1-phosphate thymidylyltransferase / UDP-N-acetylgalactosamine diphosphorylase / glucosamine-1-phosphate N-acetyltransferase / galactosamine-1-phosphate N-acetyltransferase